MRGDAASRAVATAEGVKAGVLINAIRVAIAPPLFDTMVVIGREAIPSAACTRQWNTWLRIRADADRTESGERSKRDPSADESASRSRQRLSAAEFDTMSCATRLLNAKRMRHPERRLYGAWELIEVSAGLGGKAVAALLQSKESRSYFAALVEKMSGCAGCAAVPAAATLNFTSTGTLVGGRQVVSLQAW